MPAREEDSGHLRPTDGTSVEGARRWLEGGALLLRTHGPAGVKLRSLAAAVERSTGSFYHHFGSFPAFLEALAADFSGDALSGAMVEARHDDPHTELRRFLHIHEARQIDDLASAMRAWSRSFVPAARAVEEAEAKVLRYFERLFRSAGSDRPTARAQATLLLSYGAAQVSTPWRRSKAEVRRIQELILGVETRRSPQDRRPTGRR